MADSAAGPTGRIFISYRRDETAYPAGWLYDRLASTYGGGQIFKDVDSIKLGDDFVQVITQAVGSCDVLLALIGDEWVTVTDEHGRRRIDDPDDFVRLEIEAALARDVRVIPILVDGARMPRADELPPSLVPLRRRQALDLSPSRFEYDTGRLLKVLDTALAEVQTDQSTAPATSSSVVPQPVSPADQDHPASAGSASVLPPEADSARLQPGVRHLRDSSSADSTTGTSDRGRSRKDVSSSGTSRTLRRVLVIGVPLVALLAAYLIVQRLGDSSIPPQDGGAQSSATNEATMEAPWRLVIQNDGSNVGCNVTLVNQATSERWSNRYGVWEEASFLIPRGGTFRWSVESGCTVVTLSGPGSLALPAEVKGVGTSDAFESRAAAIRVELKGFLSGATRCAVELRDVADGTVVDSDELNEQRGSVTLDPEGRPLVYLVNDWCKVRVSRV